MTVVLLATGAVSGLLLWGAYAIAPVAGCILESIMTYQILATKCLKVESMKVYERLRADDLAGARNAVAMIVGRDTQNLDAAGVAKAAVETVAENTSDGVIAPMICLAIGGPVLGFLYKAVNTMDSMVGYKNERYLNFGRTAAKLDDVVNYIPARISAALMMRPPMGRENSFPGKMPCAFLSVTVTIMQVRTLPRPRQPVRVPCIFAWRGCKLFWKNRKKAIYRG